MLVIELHSNEHCYISVSVVEGIMERTSYPGITSALALQFVKAANPKVQMGKCLPSVDSGGYHLGSLEITVQL